MKNVDLSNIKIDEKSYQKVLICYTGYGTPNNVKSLHLIIGNAKVYIEEQNGNKYLFNTSSYWWKEKCTQKIWRPIDENNNSDRYEEKYMQISLDDYFLLKNY